MKVDRSLLMTAREGRRWHEYKASMGPLYPGYPNFDIYMNWLKDRFAEYGCVDFLEHHWTHETYRVNDWPDHESGALDLEIEGEKIPVGTFLMLSPSTGKEGLKAPLIYHDASRGGPENGEFEGRIVVMEERPMPSKPFTDQFLASYVITDTNYRSGPEEPREMLEIVDPEKNNSWNTRWSFFQWMNLVKLARKGKAAGMIIVSRLTYGTLKGLYDRQQRHDVPSLVIDRTLREKVVGAAKEGKNAKLTLISEFFPADAWNFLCFLPGRHYGTDRDEYVSINNHVDAMSLTQDNGCLGSLGIARYFSHIPQEEREKTLLFCIDSRHFIEGFENGNFAHDPYQVYPEVAKKVVVTIGLEHMGEMEAAEDYANNTMVPTGRPEYSFMKADDNDWCARVLIEAAIDSGLERADIKIDGRPGIHGMYKGLVRAVQASVHRLGKCVIGEAGNWPGAHTQTFSGMEYFGEKKFRDEVHLWTQVTGCMMETDSIVYDTVWSDLNIEIRRAAAEDPDKVLQKLMPMPTDTEREVRKDRKVISERAKEGLLSLVSGIFRRVEDGSYLQAADRLEREAVPAAQLLGADEVTAAAKKAAEALREYISRREG